MIQTPAHQALPLDFQIFAEKFLGSLREVRSFSWAHAESRVWALTGERSAFLKVLRQPSKFKQELYAYRTWLPQLEHVPKLIAADEARQMLLLSALSGETLEHTSLNQLQRRNAYEQAGTFLRTLHSLPYTDTNPVSLPQAYWQRAESWATRSDGIVERETRDWVLCQAREAADTLDALNVRRVPCHRDYTERNWLVTLNGRDVTLAVIDFEHARSDYWLSDLEKLYMFGWERELEDAFWQGYSRRPTVNERLLLYKAGVLAAFTTIVWAREHCDAAFESRGWQHLNELKKRLG